MVQSYLGTHRPAKPRSADRVREALKFGPLERFQLDARIGRESAAHGLAELQRTGIVERINGVGWQLIQKQEHV